MSTSQKNADILEQMEYLLSIKLMITKKQIQSNATLNQTDSDSWLVDFAST
jgi:hypothetical protein